MTVPVSDRLSQLYVGNGTNTRFDFTFRVFNQEDENGVVIRIKNGSEFETLDPASYAVTLNPDDMGGYITFNIAPMPSYFFYIAGATPLDQLLDITNYDNFYPDAIERALDKLTALLQEWGTQLDQEKQARILADIHYDSLAMEREENLEGRLISYLNAIVGITNPKIFDGITDRMVITKDGRTQREFNESIPFWTDDYVNFKQQTYLREEQILDHVDEQNQQLSTELKAAVDTEEQRAIAVENSLQNQMNNIGSGRFGFNTYAEFDAKKATISANSVVNIAESNNTGTGQWGQGDNIWDGTTLKKSPYDPGQQALAQARAISQEEALKATSNTLITDASALLQLSDMNGDIPLSVNAFGEWEGIDFKTENGSLDVIAQGVLRQDLGDFTHIEQDSEGNILFGTKTDGSFTAANPSLKFGLADLRAGSVPTNEIQALGIALDQNATENDTPYVFEVEVSPYMADGTQAQRMAAAIKIGPNKLYVAYTQFSVYNNDQQDGRLVARIVDYDLVTKTATISETISIIGNKTGNNYRHPHFIRLKDRILLIFNGNTPDLLVYESLDNCATWQLKTQIPTTIAEPWALALDSVVRIEEGMYAGRIVAALFNSPGLSKLETVYSDDDGVTWKRGKTINNAEHFPTYSNLNEISVACDAHNDLIFAIRNETLAVEARYIIFAKSTDGGHSFQFFNQNIKTPTVGVQIGMKQIAPNSFGGGVPKIISTHPVGNNRTQFILRVSYDGCQSWAYDYKPWPMFEMVGYSSLVPLSAKDYALVVEKGPMLKEQSIAIKFLNLREIM